MRRRGQRGEGQGSHVKGDPEGHARQCGLALCQGPGPCGHVWPATHLPPVHGLQLCVSRSLWGDSGLTEAVQTEGSGCPRGHVAVLAWAEVVACTATGECPKTLENHSGAETTTDPKPPAFRLNLARMLLAVHMKQGPFCERSHASDNQRRKRIPCLAQVFPQDKGQCRLVQ